jgi:sporulation protein YlmC with PRC-barrel domain
MIFAATALAALMTAVVPAVNADTIHADQTRASKVIGAAVYDANNDKIGTVQDLILNGDGKVALAVVDVGSFLGMGGKDVAVDLNDIKASNDRLTLDRTKQQLRDAPAYQLENKVTGAGTTASSAAGVPINH